MENTEEKKQPVDSTDKNMQDLINAAKLKLQAQEETSVAEEDIYASMREELDDDYVDQEEFQINNTDVTLESNTPKIQYEPDEDGDYYIDPDDEPAFEDGPGISQIEIWKKQFEKEKIYHTQIIDRHFVFRTLNRFEYKQIVAYENLDALRREELICQTCTLWPYNYNFKTMAADDSGYPSTLAQIIMENSGFTKEYGIEVL